jgi:hypothetical protein
MSRDDQVIYGEINATIAFVIRGVAKEDTPSGPMDEFVGRGGGSVRVARTVKMRNQVVSFLV